MANKGSKKVKPSHNSNCSSNRKMTKKEEEMNEKRKEDAFCKQRGESKLHKALSTGRSMTTS